MAMVGRIRLHAPRLLRSGANQCGGAGGAGTRMPACTGRTVYVAALAAMLSLFGSAAFAEESMFAYVYTTDLLPQGGKEVEQWLTWRHQKNSGTYDQIEGRTEFEYGLASNLQA